MTFEQIKSNQKKICKLNLNDLFNFDFALNATLLNAN